MSHKIKSFKEWQRKRSQNKPDSQSLYEEIRNMVCVAFSTRDTEAVMEKVLEYGLAQHINGVKSLARILSERVV